MTKHLGRMVLLTSIGLVALLTVGGATALAHGGGGGKGGPGGPGGPRGPGGAAISSSLVTAAAKELGVTPAALRTAMREAAKVEIDQALADEDIDADEAADLKEQVDDNLSFAYSLSRASVVATKAGKTTAQLNAAFKSARKAAHLKKIDEAVEDGELDAEEAAELKAELEDATLPGYKPSRFSFGRGFGR